MGEGALFTLSGIVRAGHHIGAELGFPTANLVLPQETLAPRVGVYAAIVTLPDGRRFAAVTDIGRRPTVDASGALWAESHLLDFSGDLYGLNITVEARRFLREERRFDSVEALCAEIARNIAQARELLANEL